MRILVFTHEYPPLGGGGGRVAQDVCQGLTKLGHDVRIITAKSKDLPNLTDNEVFKVIRLASKRREAYRADLKAMFGFLWASFWEGLKQIRTWKPDVMHVHFAVPAGASAFFLHIFTKLPYVITAHLGDVPGGVPEKTNKWFQWIFPLTPSIWRKAGGIAAVSDYTKSLALKSYDVPIEVIQNGVDLEKIDPGKIEVGSPPRIVFAGRFAEQKNLFQLVKTLADIRDLPWVCTLIGDGPLFEAIKQEIEQNNLQDRISLTGWIAPENVIEYYKNCDILFMPSLSEGLPVVGVQAMAMGLALVFSRVGGCIDLVEEEKNGYLVDPTHPSGYAEALRELLTDPERLLHYRLASRQLANKFSLEQTVKKYERLLEKVIRQPK